MPNSFTKYISAALLGVAVLSSCSRPVAYFQRGSVQSYATPVTQIETAPVANQAAEAPTDMSAQANVAVSQLEAYVSQDSKLVADKKLGKRMIRVKKLLASTAVTVHPKAPLTIRRMNIVERLILTKMNRQINHQLAPAHPERAMVKTGQLIGSLVLLIAGLVLLIAGTGTVAFIGLIIALIGALGTVISLIGIDS